jgi:phospholipid N-methyltransferase
MTRRILEKKSRDARFLALERNPNFVTTLRALFPHLHVVSGCASKLKSHAAKHDFHGADSIVSGLPWAIFDPQTQRSILSGIHDVLSPGGVFATFAYFGPHWLPGGQAFRSHLDRQFATVRTSRVVLANLPPAFVYYCGK